MLLFLIDTSSVWYKILVYISWAFLGLCIYLVCFAVNKVFGLLGENTVKNELKKLPKNKYKVFHDILINNDGVTCQIDHIVVSEYGIFVIETKNYHGFIKGSKYDKKWVVYSNKKGSYLLGNPIHQNYGHILALEKLINVDESCFFNLVCFTGGANIKIDYNGNLVSWDNLVSRLLSYNDKIIVNIDEINKIIKKNNIRGCIARRKHIKYWKSKH